MMKEVINRYFHKNKQKQEKIMPSLTITIMADIGNGPYAWIKDTADDSRYVGRNIADACTGFGYELSVSDELEMDFMNWVVYFEKNYNNPNYDWIEFNRHGVEMTKRLYLELNGIYRVIYEKPIEDPGHETQRQIEISLTI